jgi:hypothetical protein
MPSLLDEVSIRLASADEGAVRRIQAKLTAQLPGTRFGGVRLGRSGDWMCDGWFDEGATPDTDEQRLRRWVAAYPDLREQLALLFGDDHPDLEELDYLLDGLHKAVVPRRQRRRRLERGPTSHAGPRETSRTVDF